MNSTIRRVRTGLVLAVGIAAIPVQARPAPAAGAKLDQVIDEDIRVRVPVHPCDIASHAAQITKAIQMPGGFESIPNVCAGSERVPADAPRINLRGLTARQALDTLVALEPRYRWIDSAGVVVMRPAAAIDDPTHFLHAAMSSYELEAPRYAYALRAVVSVLYARPGVDMNAPMDHVGVDTPQGTRPINVRVSGSPYEMLNSIVRAHGALRWRMSYCAAEARPQFSTLMLETYDGSGLGDHPIYPPDANGRQLVNCRPFQPGPGGGFVDSGRFLSRR